MTRLKLGLALCGSYCTYDKLFPVARRLAERYELVPIMSDTAAKTDTRFGRAEEHKKTLCDICGRVPVCTVAEAEPLGPAEPMDALIIAPCTGNTMAKLANGITDSSVLMAAKAHLRNGRPLVIAFSTNDGLSGSLKNIAELYNRKNIYLVPFGQDDHIKKPNSLASDFSLIEPTLLAALEHRQLHPVFCSHGRS